MGTVVHQGVRARTRPPRARPLLRLVARSLTRPGASWRGFVVEVAEFFAEVEHEDGVERHLQHTGARGLERHLRDERHPATAEIHMYAYN